MDPEKILQKLIKFNTTNPPGNEFKCINYIKQLLEKSGIESKTFYKDPKRLNLYARIKGKGKSAPLLFYGHVDVVTALNQNWQHPPFSGKIINGFVWGRGALDMKGGIAIILSAIIKAKKNKIRFPGDVILCFLSDEEEEGKYGAGFMVEKHKELFKDVKYAISEFGGFSFYVGGKKFYPVQVAEKQICRIGAVFKGTPGHGSMYIADQAMKRMAAFISKAGYSKFPVHITPVVKMMFKEIAGKLKFPANLILKLLLNPLFTNNILKMLGPSGDMFQPLFRNILNPTIILGGDKINVIPPQVSLKLDGRILPGITAEEFISEIKNITGNIAELKILEHHEFNQKIDMGLFETLKKVLKEMDNDGHAVPLLLPGSTDARFFSRLGIQTYGFIPMPMLPEISFFKTIHGENECVLVSALKAGADCIYNLLQIF